MTTKLEFVALGAAATPEAPLPTPPKSPGNYGLVYDAGRKALVYAPSTEHHAAGAAWTWDGSAWKPLASGTARGSSVSQPWRAVWDSKRGSVVVWSWDYTPGPIGVVVREGSATPLVLSSDKAARGEVLGGQTPLKADDTEWDGCCAMFGFDVARGVTVCVNEAGLWELEGSRWHRRDVAVDVLPKEVKGSGFTSNGFGSVYDTKHARVVFWAQDHADDVVSLVAWDGKTLTKLDTSGLPEDLCGWRGGFAVGDHPEHGLVVLSGEGDAKLFALKAKGGGLKALAEAPGGPQRFSAAQLAFDPSRKELVLGPQKTKTKEHRFFVLGAAGWRALGRSVAKSALGEERRTFVTAGGRTYAISIRGNVASWDEASATWKAALSGEDAEKTFEAPVQIAVRGWNDRAFAVSADGAVFRLDDASGGLKWTKVSAKSKDFGAPLWPLAAFDEARGLLVVWGDSKKSRGRKDDTFVFDGKTWSKAKKGKEKPDGLDYKDDDPFTLFYEPAAGAVARLSNTQIALFDGKTWTHTKHRGGKLAVAWDQTVCTASGKTDVLLVKRHMAEREVVRLRRGKDGYTLAKVATFESPVKRGPNDTGGNAAFDVGWFDSARARFIAHFPEDASLNFALDLSPLFEK